MVKSTASCRKVTVERVLGETAATQMRNDINAPTSRKEVRTAFALKCGRSAACGDEDEFDDYVLCPNPTEQDLIEQKRRQNTIASRKSWKRKLEHLQSLENSLKDERRQKEQWQQRALMLVSMLHDLNKPVPNFSNDW